MSKETEIDQYISPHNSRGALNYYYGLFPDDPTGIKILNPFFYKIEGAARKDVEKVFKHSPSSCENQHNSSLYSREYINRIFGGQRVFFNKNSKILDLGCGVGKATTELSKLKGINIIGMDIRYGNPNKKPLYRSFGSYIGGDWNNLPFKDNAFSGILSFESFPSHGGWGDEMKETFKEITRIAAPGAIWRATVGIPGLSMGDPNEEKGDFRWNYKNNEIIPPLNENGWDVYYGKMMFIARLNLKK